MVGDGSCSATTFGLLNTCCSSKRRDVSDLRLSDVAADGGCRGPVRLLGSRLRALGAQGWGCQPSSSCFWSLFSPYPGALLLFRGDSDPMKTLVIGLDCAALDSAARRALTISGASCPEAVWPSGASFRRSFLHGCACRFEPDQAPGRMVFKTGPHLHRSRRRQRRVIYGPAIWDVAGQRGGQVVVVAFAQYPRKVNGVSIGCFLTPDPYRTSSHIRQA